MNHSHDIRTRIELVSYIAVLAIAYMAAYFLLPEKKGESVAIAIWTSCGVPPSFILVWGFVRGWLLHGFWNKNTTFLMGLMLCSLGMTAGGVFWLWLANDGPDWIHKLIYPICFVIVSGGACVVATANAIDGVVFPKILYYWLGVVGLITACLSSYFLI